MPFPFRSVLRAASAAVCSALALAAAGPAGAQGFTLWVTETPAGGTTPYVTQQLGGVRSYVFNGLGYAPANITTGPLIAASALNDPSAVTVAANGNLLISNRGFNTGPGSVSRVTFTGTTPNAPTVALSNIDTGPHQAAVTSTGGLVVSSFSSGGKLYPGVTTPSTLSFASGAQRGAVTSGNLLYSTSGGNVLQTFNLGTGAQIGGNFSVPGAIGLHYATLFGGSLYVADVGSGIGGSGGGVYKVTLDGSGNPLASSKVANVDGAISVMFSPSGDEMFVAGHFSGVITGFGVSAGVVAPTSNLTIDGGTLASWAGAHVTFGGMAVTAVPEPAALALMLAGVAGVLLRTRRRRD